MNFGDALEAVKSGAKIYREGWNGKGQHVFLVKPPQSAEPNEPKYEMNLDDTYAPASNLTPFLMLRNSQAAYCVWVPSTGDLFANDWLAEPIQ
ncbi:DUF2829 domain-containing protein [Phytobacter sp. AG2a]